MGDVHRGADRTTGLLREDLGEAGYTVDVVEALLGPLASAALHREQPVPARRLLARLVDERDDSPHATLVRLFLLAQPVTRSELDAALPSSGTDALEGLGITASSGLRRDDTVVARLDLRPHAAEARDADGRRTTADWWVVSDLGETATGEALDEEHVLGVGGASVTLAGATVRRRVARALDLGTGCGVQALHAAQHADHVVATDLSERALSMADLSLRLSGVPAGTVELRQGDLLDPVEAERFDLVVSNPPFVITPRRSDVPTMQYRDGGLAGDEVVRRVVTGAGHHLRAGGLAQLLGNWEVPAGATWEQVVGRWLDDAAASLGEPIDAWVVQRDVQDPAEYAETWIRDGGLASGAQYEAMYRAWLDDLESRHVEAIGFGLVTLRRPGPGTRPLRRVEELVAPTAPGLGDHVDACLAAHDALPDGDGLLSARLQVAPDVSEVRHHRPGEADPQVIELRQGGGFGRTVRVGTTVAAVVGACDGELAVGQITAAVAQLLGRGPGEVAAEVLPAVRELVLDGFLTPA